MPLRPAASAALAQALRWAQGSKLWGSVQEPRLPEDMKRSHPCLSRPPEGPVPGSRRWLCPHRPSRGVSGNHQRQSLSCLPASAPCERRDVP